jgi:hypothetical protein
MKHVWTLKLIIISLVQYYVCQHVHVFAGQRRRLVISKNVRMLINLVDLFYANKNDSPLHLHQTISFYIPGLDPKVIEQI